MIARRQRRKSVQNSDPGKILDLVMSLTDDKSAQLQTKINTYLVQECEAEQALLVAVSREHSDAFIEAVGSSMLLRKRKICLTEKFKLVLESVGEQTEYLSNMEEDFRSFVEPTLGTENPKKRVVMFPIPDDPFSLIVCIVSPTVQEDRVGLIIYEAFLFFWPVLKKSIMLEYERTVKYKCQQLLRVARKLFTQVEKLQTLLHMAMEQAKMLMSAEYCSVMLIDVDQMDLVEIYDPMELHMTNTETVKRRFKMDVGIAGIVVNTGNLVNVKNPEKHPKFNPEIDSYPGITCRSLLCFPIRDQSGIIGVGSLYNKLGDPYFDAMDEEMALAFSVYCGVCIVHSMVYQKMQEAHIRNALANELVMYHMKVGDAEVSRLLECTGFHKHPHIASLSFNVRALPPRELPCYVLKMFSDLGLQKKFNLHATKLARFVLHVKKGYRDVPYHNWMHAFNVAQWAYAALINYKLVSSGYLTDLQALMYLIACLVHDLDHRGTTNRFQIMGQTSLAALYSSEGSVMERHHLAQAVCVLNTEGCDVLAALPRADYDRAIIMLKDYVLATDLANFFKNLPEYEMIAMDYQKGNRLHCAALQALLMNSADLSDQLKDWSVIKKTAAAVLTEFFKQGELEKSRGEPALAFMDRDKCFIPALEQEFLTTTCMPLYSLLAKIIPKAEACTKVLEGHLKQWEAASYVFSEVPISAGLSVLLSPELDNLIEQSIKEREEELMEGAKKAEATDDD
ncbi:cGMP-dependent 3',5'-cyclic phosphodiesterase [Papilio machaon]|uniref:Phosphodiesterase n=1 Tax=Papilio machaon TaxID=76193 RepID=A0A194QTM5_PAPMA|nr:cGMP-dependent 3',5'-cyclic phosphodiesterase [Papilio machaon]